MEKELCLRPGCGRERRSRGLCINCYTACQRLVLDERTSLEKLEASGKALPTVRGKIFDWFLSGKP